MFHFGKLTPRYGFTWYHVILRVLLLTAPLDVSQALKEDGPNRPCGTSEVLEAHVTELASVYVEVLEGDAGGVDLVHVQCLLKPVPHLVFGPVLRLRLLGPQAAGVARCYHGNCRWKAKCKHMAKNEVYFLYLIFFKTLYWMQRWYSMGDSMYNLLVNL